MAPRPSGSHPSGSPAELGITAGQMRVMTLLMQGKSNKAICRTLGLAEPTVKRHVSAILRALKVNNRTEAALAVSARGWRQSIGGAGVQRRAAGPRGVDATL